MNIVNEYFFVKEFGVFFNAFKRCSRQLQNYKSDSYKMLAGKHLSFITIDVLPIGNLNQGRRFFNKTIIISGENDINQALKVDTLLTI